MNYISMKGNAMQRFIGRKRELSALNAVYEKKGFRMTVLYGRRRIGKSTLLQKFVEDKKTIFYTAVRSSLQRNLELMSKRVLETLAPQMKGLSFASFDELFSFLTNQSLQERIVFAIDEFPYLAEQDPSILSVLQKYIDTEWMQGNLYLILCGSSVSFMEDEVLSEKSPLFGRRTSQIRLQAFNYQEAAEFVPEYSYEDKAICYGVTGGIARYLALWDSQKSLDENLINLFFSTSGYLYEEPAYLLTQEFRNISSYSAIIEAVASGRNKMTEIADISHLEASTVSHALRNLIATGILKKNYAITDERNKKKVQYTLSDHMFRFWYRFVPNGIDSIELGKGDVYYQIVVRPCVSDYMGNVFEDMCRYYTLQNGMDGNFACRITRVGKWWGTNPAKKEETDIDIVGLDTVSKNAVLGECKFKNETIDKKVFDELLDRNGLIDHQYHTVQYLLFSKKGFSDWIVNHAEKERIRTITLKQLYEPF
jgi:AAA+ ATPase superfamily predicted ATPase